MERPSQLSIVEVKDKSVDDIDSKVFKIVLVGDSAVGKSNILSRYVKDEFNRESKSTVGVELSTKVFKIDKTVIKVHLWDTAGQERYNSITGAYYKGAKGAMIAYDVTREDTFASVERWHKEIQTLADKNAAIMLIGNKCDLNLLRRVKYEDAVMKSTNLNIPYIETSALDSSNIDKAFKQLILEIYISTIRSNLNAKIKEDCDYSNNDYDIQEGEKIKIYESFYSNKNSYSNNLNNQQHVQKQTKCQC